MYNLATRQEYQNEARNEIRRVLKKYDYEITYDAIEELKYVQQCIDGI